MTWLDHFKCAIEKKSQPYPTQPSRMRREEEKLEEVTIRYCIPRARCGHISPKCKYWVQGVARKHPFKNFALVVINLQCRREHKISILHCQHA